MKDDLFEIYEQVLAGKRKKFPDGTWNPSNSGKESLGKVFKYLIEDKLKWDRKQVLENLTVDFFAKWKLRGATQKLFDDSPIGVINFTYPEWQVKPWEFKFTSRDTWKTVDDIKAALRWLLIDKLKWSRKDILHNFNLKTLEKHRLNGAVTTFRELTGSAEIYELIKFSFPEYEFKVEDFHYRQEWENWRKNYGKLKSK